MKHRIRATFCPPLRLLRSGAMPEQIERFTDGHEQLADEVRALIVYGEALLKIDARVVIEIMPISRCDD